MSMKSALSIFSTSFLAVALAPGQVDAATTSASFSVSVTVQAACAISASSMRFEPHDLRSVSATSTVSVNCIPSTPYNVGLSAGLAPGATVANRKMIGPGSALLGYSLQSDAGGIVNWVQTVGVDTVAGTGKGSVRKLSVLGQIPAGQYVADGAYADTITVTVTY
jgi:spore coat protein U-like protein